MNECEGGGMRYAIEDVMRMEKRIAELEASRSDLCYKIKELEGELASMKSAHVTGATVHPAMCDQYTKVCADNARLRGLLKRISDLCITGNTAIEHVISDIAREGLE
jgi:hypothetical protein